MEKETLGNVTMGPVGHNDEYLLRQKGWDECSVDEKLLKLRSEAESMEYVWDRISKLEQQVRFLSRHSHADGKVVLPVEEVNNSAYLGGVSTLRNKLR